MALLDRLHIEVTNVCNFKCEFCPDAIMERRRGHMDLELLRQILDELAAQPITRTITFHLMGEPLIYPDIFAAIEMAAERHLQLHLTTNGSTFQLKPDHVERLVNSGIPKVTISLQTPDPSTFTLRGAPPKLSASAYFEGIIRYVQTNLKAATSPTRVHIKFLDTTPNPFLVPHKPMQVVEGKNQMRETLSRWASHLLADLPDCPDLAWIEQQIDRHRPGRWQLIPLHPKLVLETFPLDSWGNVEAESVVSASFGYCNGAAQQAGILHDGTVVPCCKDFEGQIPLGNVKEQPLRDILNAAPACQLRQGFDRWQVENPV
ncbi:MAG: radical SAM protein, partial [Cyanobacteria bacterium Co-bin8]|nr:radical SAM protein [Cyanobacteria bacterium Co-bin8]